MRSLRRFALALLTLALLAAPAAAHAATGFVTRSGTRLMLDGRPFRFDGVDYWYGAKCYPGTTGGAYNAGCNDNVMNTDLTALDQQLPPGTPRVLRVWFLQREVTLNGARSWAPFDHVLSIAAAHGYHVLPVLVDEWPFESESPSTGLTGSNFYGGKYKTAVLNGDTVPYLQYVKQVTARYKSNRTVLAWQVGNELQDGGTGTCPSSGAHSTLLSFTKNVVSAIRAADPNHLVNTGELYDSCGTGGTNFENLENVAGYAKRKTSRGSLVKWRHRSASASPRAPATTTRNSTPTTRTARPVSCRGTTTVPAHPAPSTKSTNSSPATRY
jgi:mannan endo-1,4-beta-mannosidase